MTYLLAKSGENEDSAFQLMDTHELYAPTVHCAYYSCIQLMIHVLLTTGGKTESAIEHEIRVNRKSSHIYYIKEIQHLINNSRNRGKVRNFSTDIYDLKEFRENSDYKNIEVTYDDAHTAIDLSTNVISTLKNIFNIQ